MVRRTRLAMAPRFTFVPLAILASAPIFAFVATPAWAASLTGGGATVDEPAALALMALGVVGLIIGRQVAKRRD